MADDEALVRAAKSGDGDALETLLRHYQPHIYRFGVKMCRNPEDAQDVLQETLLAAARSLRGFRGDSSMPTWLYTIARSFCIKKRRRSVFAPEVVSLESEARHVASAPDASPDPERDLAGREAAAALEAALAALEPAYREVLLLRDVEGLSAAEVAKVTGLSVAAVKSRLHRARSAVRARLAPFLGTPPPPPATRSGACPDVVDLLSRHLEGDIGPETCAEMEAHVKACAQCKSACESLRRTLSLCATVPSPEVPESVKAAIRRDIRSLIASGRN